MKTPSFHRSLRARGFTLVELLVVITIIAVIASLGFGAGLMAIQKAKKTTALATATAIETAVNNFFTEYGTMPTNTDSDTDLVVKTDTDIVFLEILLGLETTLNTRGIRFLNVKEGKGDKNGLIYDSSGDTVTGLYDPWGGPFHVMMDLDFDEKLDIPDTVKGGGKKLNGRRVAVWSLGADGVSGSGGELADDVTTW